MAITDTGIQGDCFVVARLGRPLYTSEAADDMQCVDIGGRRNIHKKIKNILNKFLTKFKLYQLSDAKTS